MATTDIVRANTERFIMKIFRLLIAGGLDFAGYDLLQVEVNRLLSEQRSTFEIVIIPGV